MRNSEGGFYFDTSSLKQVYPLPLISVEVKPFMVFRGVLSAQQCRRLISKYGPQVKKATGGEYGQAVIASQYGIMPNEEPRLFADMAAVLVEANSHYRYALSGIYEPFRLLAYTQGEYNGLHSDYGTIDRSKLSFSVKLNSDYLGDGLRVLNSPLPKLKPGDAVVFPSWTAHEAMPCRSGVRYSLVGWAAGPQFA